MFYLPAKLSEATQTDLQTLIDAPVTEGQHLEFKRELPANGREASAEFISDVSAFANATGGELVYGMDQDASGNASCLLPLDINPDLVTLQLQNKLDGSIEPRLPGIQVRPVAVEVGGKQGFAVVVRVPQSWMGPHRNTVDQRFYLRVGPQKRPMDVTELRARFTNNEGLALRQRNFRTERVSRLISGQTPMLLHPNPVLAFHLLPAQAVLGEMAVDVKRYLYEASHNSCMYLPVFGSSPPARCMVNLDGVFAEAPSHAVGVSSYSLFFREGFFEAALAIDHRPEKDGPTTLPAAWYEKQCVRLVAAFRSQLEELGYRTDMTAMLSLINFEGVRLGYDTFNLSLLNGRGTFDRAVSLLPDVRIPEEMEPEDALRPLFDTVWQCCGHSRSYNYTVEGKWQPLA